MADCYIEEYEHVGSGGGSYWAPGMPPTRVITVQKIAIGAATQSNAFNAKTQMIVITSDGDCHFAIGSDPTASTSTAYLPAKVPRFFGVAAGDKISIST